MSANSDAVASGRKRRRQEPSYEDTSSLNRGEPSANNLRQVFRLHPQGVLRRRDRAGISPASLFSRNDNKKCYGHLKSGSKNEELRWANLIHHDSPCQPPSPFFSRPGALTLANDSDARALPGNQIPPDRRHQRDDGHGNHVGNKRRGAVGLVQPILDHRAFQPEMVNHERKTITGTLKNLDFHGTQHDNSGSNGPSRPLQTLRIGTGHNGADSPLLSRTIFFTRKIARTKRGHAARGAVSNRRVAGKAIFWNSRNSKEPTDAERSQKERSARQNLRVLRAPLHLAQEMGKGLGAGQILLGSLQKETRLNRIVQFSP
jgi:hypothetical protein